MLDSQAGQIRAQAMQESEHLARNKNASLQLLQKVASGWGRRGGGKGAGSPFAHWSPLLSYPLLSESAALGLQEKEKLTMLERRYHSLMGGRPFPKTSSSLKEVVVGLPKGFSWEILEQRGTFTLMT